MFSQHVTRDISAYCHGELSPEESRYFAEHLISCSKCRTKFEEIKLGIKFAEQLPLLSAPDHLWANLESQLDQGPHTSQVKSGPVLSRPVLAIAATVIIAMTIGTWWLVRQQISSHGPSWQVLSLEGTPLIGSKGFGEKGRLGVGQWLETDANSRAQIAVGSIGNVEIDENTRIKLVGTKPTEHRLELAKGKMSAQIWAPPRLFFVDTPSAVAADLGCAYTLEVNDDGSSLLRVTSGWVALELKERESIVPAGAACETRPGVGPGTPYFEDCAGDFRQALEKVDFSNNAAEMTSSLDFMLLNARERDTLTLWHLLSRVDVADRGRIFDRIASYSPPPRGVTREGILKLDRIMLELWKEDLRPTWYDWPTKFALLR
jgi:hypothetical protein